MACFVTAEEIHTHVHTCVPTYLPAACFPADEPTLGSDVRAALRQAPHPKIESRLKVAVPAIAERSEDSRASSSGCREALSAWMTSVLRHVGMKNSMVVEPDH